MGGRPEMSANPKLYREMEPFESVELAQRASDAFFEELAELRKKHKITDVLAVCKFSYNAASGEESEAITMSSWGNAMNIETLAAYALGMIQAERQERIGALLKVKRGKRA
jgi:hypothetical protein